MRLLTPAFLIVAIFSFTFVVTAQRRHTTPRREIVQNIITAPVPETLSPEKQRRLDCFMVVWKTIRDNYFDPTYSNLNWENIRIEFDARVRNAADDRQLYALLNEMIGRLNRSHFAIIQPEVFDALKSARRKARVAKTPEIQKGTGTAAAEEPDDEDESDGLEPAVDEHSTYGIGVELRILDNKFVIARVDKNSAAAVHGLKPGYVIERVNGVSLTELLRRIDLLQTAQKRERRYLPFQIVSWFLNGKEGTTVDLEYLDEGDVQKEIKIAREKLTGELVSLGKDFPIQSLEFQTEALPDGVGYIRFNIFAMPTIPKFCNALTEFKDKKALVIDLRGNLGGVIGTMMALGGMLTDSKIDLGTEIYRVGSENLTASAKQKRFTGPVVVLIDNLSISSAEVFSAALKENGRAILIGERSAGEALPALSVKLPTGAVLVYPIANFKTRTGALIEGKGVEPNIVVALTREQLLKGNDPQLTEALTQIRKGVTPAKAPMPDPPGGIGSGIDLGEAPELPPPPVAKAPSKLRTLASVTLNASPPPAVKVAPPPAGKDSESTKAISDFLAKIGGVDAIGKIKAFEMTGTSDLVLRSTEVTFDYDKVRDADGRYGEFIRSDQTGEIRQISNGTKSFVQTDFGTDIDVPMTTDPGEFDMLGQIVSLSKPDTFKSLTYRGTFDRAGRKSAVIEAVMSDGTAAALAFDVETKLLVSFSKRYLTFSFADYRKVGEVMLPYYFELGSLMKIRLKEIKLDPKIEPGRFDRKTNCFDIAN